MVIFILKHFPFNEPPTANPNNIPDFRNVVLYELSFLLVGILDFGIEKWKANVTRPEHFQNPIIRSGEKIRKIHIPITYTRPILGKRNIYKLIVLKFDSLYAR